MGYRNAQNGIAIDDIEVAILGLLKQKANIAGFSHTIKERMNYQQIFSSKKNFFPKQKLR